jgi:hypothetical protein
VRRVVRANEFAGRLVEAESENELVADETLRAARLALQNHFAESPFCLCGGLNSRFTVKAFLFPVF